MNDLLDAKGSGFGKGNAYARLKKEWTEKIGWALKAAKLKPVGPAEIHFEWLEKNKRRDPDNSSSGGRKLILDALVTHGILEGDGWAHVIGFSDDFLVADKGSMPGVWVTISGDLAADSRPSPLR